MIRLYLMPMRIWSIHPKYLDTKGLVASRFKELNTEKTFEPHPMFNVVKGKIEKWEIVQQQ